MTRLLHLGSIALLAAAPAFADDLDDVLHSLSARRHGETSFVEHQFLSLLKKPVESSGELVYDAPDRLEKRTLEPRPEDLVLKGEELTVVRGGRSRVVDLKVYPAALPFVESIRATLAGDRAALERVFKVRFSGAAEHWTLDLVPLEASVAKSVAEVRIEGAGVDLLEVEIRQADGDHSIMSLSPPRAQ
jgi:hypothetical protein